MLREKGKGKRKLKRGAGGEGQTCSLLPRKGLTSGVKTEQVRLKKNYVKMKKEKKGIKGKNVGQIGGYGKKKKNGGCKNWVRLRLDLEEKSSERGFLIQTIRWGGKKRTGGEVVKKKKKKKKNNDWFQQGTKNRLKMKNGVPGLW